MNTRNILASTLIGSALIAGVSSAQAQGPLRTDTISGAQVARGYIFPRRNAIVNKNLAQLPVKLQSVERILNSQGFTVTNSKDVWTAVPNLPAAELSKQLVANETAASTASGASGATVYDTLSKDWEVGDKSSAYAQTTFSLTHSANRNMARLQGDAQFNGALFGDSANLAEAKADFNAPATGNQTAQMSLSLLGQTVWSKSDSGATSASINDGFNYSGKLWQIGFDYTLGGFGVAAEVWVQGSVGTAFGGNCVPKNVNVTAYTTASLSVGGRVAADLVVVGAELDAELTLAKVEFISTASTSSGMLTTPIINPITHKVSTTSTPAMFVHREVDVDLTLIEGYVVGKITDPIFGSTIAQHYFVNEPNGLYQYSDVLADYTSFHFLP